MRFGHPVGGVGPRISQLALSATAFEVTNGKGVGPRISQFGGELRLSQ